MDIIRVWPWDFQSSCKENLSYCKNPHMQKTYTGPKYVGARGTWALGEVLFSHSQGPIELNLIRLTVLN